MVVTGGRVEVVLEGGRTVARGGELLRGEVLVVLEQPTKCRELKIELVCATTGRGRAEAVRLEDEVLFKGDLEAGEHRFPFSRRLPRGPFTYEGKNVSVGWVLEAWADMPWASFESRCVMPLEVVPSKEIEPGTSTPMLRPEALMEQRETSVQSLWFVAMTFGLAAVIAGMAFVGDMWGMWVVAGLVGVLGLAFAAFSAFLMLAEWRLGDVAFEFEAQEVSPGDAVAMSFEFEPRMRTRVKGVSMTLAGQETTIRGSGKHTKVYTHAVGGASYELMGARDVGAGEQVRVEHVFTVPEGLPPSFAFDVSHLSWKIRYTIDVAWWPDWRGERSMWLGSRERKGW